MYGDPAISSFRNAVYVPFADNGPWGLYDDDDQVIKESIDLRGADREPHHNTNWIRSGDVYRDDARQPYLYCGRLNPHFGHFIINSLPKFWPIWSNYFRMRPKLLCSEPVSSSVPRFMTDILEQLGIEMSDFVWFDRPTQICEAFVPTPCLLEQYWVYTIFKDMCHKIGSAWYQHCEVDTVSVPAYISKSRLKTGVGRFVGESRIDEIMQNAGIDIIYPEQMDMRKQVRLFATRKLCIGPTGSAFHSTIFAPKHRKFITYNPADRVNSNFDLLDKLNENDATYLYQPGMDYASHEEGFLTSVRLANLDQLAYDLIDEAESQSDWRRNA